MFDYILTFTSDITLSDEEVIVLCFTTIDISVNFSMYTYH